MKAAGIDRFGPPDVIEIEELDVPSAAGAGWTPSSMGLRRV